MKAKTTIELTREEMKTRTSGCNVTGKDEREGEKEEVEGKRCPETRREQRRDEIYACERIESVKGTSIREIEFIKPSKKEKYAKKFPRLTVGKMEKSIKNFARTQKFQTLQ